MKPIQFIFVAFFLFLIFYFDRKVKQHLLLKISLWLIFLGAIFFTLFPDLSTLIANMLGIGRGVDLIIYLGLIGLLISCVLLYMRIVSLERKLAQLVREQAIRGAANLNDGDLANSLENHQRRAGKVKEKK